MTENYWQTKFHKKVKKQSQNQRNNESRAETNRAQITTDQNHADKSGIKKDSRNVKNGRKEADPRRKANASKTEGKPSKKGK